MTRHAQTAAEVAIRSGKRADVGGADVSDRTKQIENTLQSGDRSRDGRRRDSRLTR